MSKPKLNPVQAPSLTASRSLPQSTQKVENLCDVGILTTRPSPRIVLPKPLTPKPQTPKPLPPLHLYPKHQNPKTPSLFHNPAPTPKPYTSTTLYPETLTPRIMCPYAPCFANLLGHSPILALRPILCPSLLLLPGLRGESCPPDAMARPPFNGLVGRVKRDDWHC